MEKILFGVASLITLSAIVSPAKAYEYCEVDGGDLYKVATIYVYGSPVPLVIDTAEDIQSFSSVISFPPGTTWATMMSDGQQLPLVDGDSVTILGLMFESDCTEQIFIYSPRHDAYGLASGEVILPR